MARIHSTSGRRRTLAASALATSVLAAVAASGSPAVAAPPTTDTYTTTGAEVEWVQERSDGIFRITSVAIYLYDGWSEVAVSTSDYHCAPGQVLPSVDAEGEYCSWVDGTVLQGFDDSVALTSSSSTVRASGTLYRFDDDGSRIDPTVIDVAVERTSKPRTTRTMSTWQGGSERVITTTGTAQLSGTIGSESVDRAGTLWEQTQIVRWR